MGAVGLEPTETEVEGFTVLRHSTLHNAPQIITAEQLEV